VGFFSSQKQFDLAYSYHNNDIVSFILYKLIFDNVNASSDYQLELHSIISTKQRYKKRLERWLKSRTTEHKSVKKSNAGWMKLTLLTLFTLSLIPNTYAHQYRISTNGMTLKDYVLANKDLTTFDFENALMNAGDMDILFEPSRKELNDRVKDVYGVDIEDMKPTKEGVTSISTIDYNNKQSVYNLFLEVQRDYKKLLDVYGYFCKKSLNYYRQYFSGLFSVSSVGMFRYTEKFKRANKFSMYSLVSAMYDDKLNVANRIYCLDALSKVNVKNKNVKSFDNIIEFIITTDKDELIEKCADWLEEKVNSSDNTDITKPGSVYPIQIKDVTFTPAPEIDMGSGKIYHDKYSTPLLPAIDMLKHNTTINNVPTWVLNTHPSLKPPPRKSTIERKRSTKKKSKSNNVIGMYSLLGASSVIFVITCACLYCCFRRKSNKRSVPFDDLMNIMESEVGNFGIFITEKFITEKSIISLTKDVLNNDDKDGDDEEDYDEEEVEEDDEKSD
jgi:hypothetical protein